MRQAPPFTQWFIWLSILAIVTVIAGAIDYYGYGFATHFKGVPDSMQDFISDPDAIIGSLSTFPQFIFTFVFLWIFIVVLIHLIWPHEITSMLRWASLTYVGVAILALTTAKISGFLDNGFDEARIGNLLNGPDYRTSGEDAMNGGSSTTDLKVAAAWQLTEKPGMRPSAGELQAVTDYLKSHNDTSAVKMEKIYRAYYVSPDIVKLLIKHPATPPLLWTTLADCAVNRLGVFYYPESHDLLSAIAVDKRTDPKFLLEFLQIPGMNFVPEVTSNPKFTPEVKQAYNDSVLPLQKATTPDKVLTAQNTDTPPALLFGLSWDSDPGVRMAVATNPSTALYTVQRLSYDKDPQVKGAARAAIQSRPIVPVSTTK